MKSLVLSSIILSLFLLSCTSSKYSGFEFSTIANSSASYKPIFDDSIQTVKFKSEINIYKNYLTGLLIVKRESDTSLHTILLTEMGIKLFDLNVKNNSYIINFALEQINRKDLIDLIAQDIRLIFINYLKNSTLELCSETKSNQRIIRIYNSGLWIYHYFDGDLPFIKRIEYASGKNPEIEMTIEYSKFNLTEKIDLKHSDLDIELGLEVLVDDE